MNEPQVNDCGCCTGIDTETPALIDNAPGLPIIRYRTGNYTQFRESLLAKLSSSEYPVLANLSTREDDDFTIALCEAGATMLDVLTFYQERIANENYLRTATEGTSLLELARLIGYTPLPGVAASTYLAFTLQESPGAPTQAAEPVTIPVATRVQSVPGPGEQAQTFETVEAVNARVEWNSIPVQTTIPWVPQLGDTDLWLDGVANQIQTSDVLLIVGSERSFDKPGSERWDIRLLIAVEIDRDNNRTRVAWSKPLGDISPPTDPAKSSVNVYVFRQRAALFGYNAPDPRLMDVRRLRRLGLIDSNNNWIPQDVHENQIDLDSTYPKITPGSWFALVNNHIGTLSNTGLQGYIELYKANQVAFPSRTSFGLSGKITQLIPDTIENLPQFGLQNTLVLAQSEQITTTERPLFDPLYGNQFSLASLHPELEPDRILAIYGKRQRIVVLYDQKILTLLFDDGSIDLTEGDSLMLYSAPEQNSVGIIDPKSFEEALVKKSSTQLKLKVQDRDGRIGILIAPAYRLRLERSQKKDPEVAEIVVIDSILPPDRDRTSLKLKSPLLNCYERATVRINANLAKATHGETVNEVLGSGDARLRNASFILKQSPLTFVNADTPSGRQSTLKLRVNDLEWKEKNTLFQQGPHDRVYATLTDAEAHTTVRFGDGKEGGLLPSGDHNIRATYRKGLGIDGNVAAGKLSTLLTRPLGVSGVSNPETANGGADGEKQEDARTNAPLTVKTLERAVSIQDYQDFARAFAGIAKAHAVKINIGPGRGVFLTVVGEDGLPLPESSDTFVNLLKALRDYGDPLIPLRLVNRRLVPFHLSAKIKLNPDADPDIVLPEVKRVLRETFGFERSEFGKGVAIDYVLAVIQNVVGVEAGFLDELYRLDTPPAPGAAKVSPRLTVETPVASYTSMPLGAELLTLDSGPITLEVMT